MSLMATPSTPDTSRSRLQIPALDDLLVGPPAGVAPPSGQCPSRQRFLEQLHQRRGRLRMRQQQVLPASGDEVVGDKRYLVRKEQGAHRLVEVRRLTSEDEE